MSLFAELKRRNVFRAAAAYLALGWVVTQVTSTVGPALHLPEWITPVVVWIGVIGFPFVLIFSWVFELTPEGIRREREVDPSASIRQVTATRLDYLAIGLFSVAIVLFAADRFMARSEVPKPAPPATAPAATPPDAPRAAEAKSIAVLPFADLSPGGDQAYFSDGMAEEILDALAQVPGLKVAGRTSSFYFKGKNETVQAIGAALGVAHVLEGSVRKQGEQVRITAQLIQTKDGFHMWSESFDGDLKNVFELQERIAHAIVGKLKLVLDGGQTRLAQKGTLVPEAHQQYLRGRYFLMRRGFANLRNAEAAFNAAIAADASYADAWAGLAQVNALLPEYSTFDPEAHGRFVDTVPQALEAAARALALDPTSARALSARAYVKTGTLFDWDGAEADYRAAIASDPHDATARQWYGEMLTYQRRFDEAVKSFDTAVEVEPLAPIVHFARGLCLWSKGDLDGAIASFEEGHRIAPELYNLNFNRVLVFVDARRFDQARAAVADMPREQQDFFGAFVAAVADGSGRERVVQEVLSREVAGITGTPVMLMMLGEHEQALAMIERLFAARDPLREFLYTHRAFTPLRSDPRFQALTRQIGLPKAAPGP